jgi:LacI family transcriptional regulator, fructose operon transcriptional repressor
MTNIKDVAKAAGVSTATVSRVLAKKAYVRTEIRQRVLQVAEDLNYQPNRVARSLRSQKSSIIGLIISDIQNPFFTAVTRAVEDVASAHEMSVFVCNSDENQVKELRYLEQLRAEKVAGIIFSPTRQTSEAFPDIVKTDLPIVLIDRQAPGADLDSVLIDNEGSAYELTEHLIQDGHRRLGAMFGSTSTTGRERRRGFLQALQDYELQADAELIFTVEAREDVGYQTTQKLLDHPHPPQAIFCSNGLMARGAFQALRESGLFIPEQIAFASFDDPPWASLIEPPLTVIRQPTQEIGRTACELLLERLRDPERATRRVVLKPSLVVRRSCGRHTS